MNTISKTLIAAAALALTATVSPAFAGGGSPTPYQAAARCLAEVCVPYNGGQVCLQEGTHFRERVTSDPNVVTAGGISLRAGLREHVAWGPKMDEIEACLNLIPSLRFTNRTDD